MEMESRFICDTDGKRLDVYLYESIEGVSRAQLQALIKEGNVTVAGELKKPSYRLSAGDEIIIKTKPAAAIDILPAKIPLSVIYEDSDLIVINKPKGMVVHPAPGHYNDTLVNALLYHCGNELSGINGVMRPGIVHRIDKDTTGLLVVAKTNEAHLSLSAQLSERRIKRVYEAVVSGVINDDEGTIDAPIGRNEKNRLKMSVNKKSGRNAVTHYNVIARYSKYTRIEARLETGRTHQIRVHMAHIGYPVLGDELYGRKSPFKLEGQTLHARSIAFFHPRTNAFVEFSCELPDYFQDLLRKLT